MAIFPNEHMWWHPSPVTIDLGKLRKQTVSKPHCEIWLLGWPAHSSHFSLASLVAVTGQIIQQEMAPSSPYSEVWLSLNQWIVFFHEMSWWEYKIACLPWAHPSPGIRRKVSRFGAKASEGVSSLWGPRAWGWHPALLMPRNHLASTTLSSLHVCHIIWSHLSEVGFDLTVLCCLPVPSSAHALPQHQVTHLIPFLPLHLDTGL